MHIDPVNAGGCDCPFLPAESTQYSHRPCNWVSDDPLWRSLWLKINLQYNLPQCASDPSVNRSWAIIDQLGFRRPVFVQFNQTLPMTMGYFYTKKVEMSTFRLFFYNQYLQVEKWTFWQESQKYRFNIYSIYILHNISSAIRASTTALYTSTQRVLHVSSSSKRKVVAIIRC